MNVFDVADTLVNHLKTNYPDDIAVIAYYGSYAQGTATKRSDLDFFFIPATSKGYQASIQFMIGDISFDFWPISWERAERMASFQEPQTTIIADCKLLYVRSTEDRERFMMLRDTISDLQEPGNGQPFVEKAESELRNAYVHLYKLSRAGGADNLTFCRIEAQRVLTKVLQSLALLNRTFYTKGFGKNKDQLLQLPVRPARLESYMHTIMHGNMTADIFQACERLTADTVELVAARKAKLFGEPSYPDRMKGFFEEVMGGLNKIMTACETNDFDTAFFFAVQVQDEIAHFLYFAETGQWPCHLTTDSAYLDVYKQAGLPELVSLLDSYDLMKLQAGVTLLSSRLENHLRTKEVTINRFESVEQFKVFLMQTTGGSAS